MAAVDMARSHVERCLQDVWSVDRVVADADGDYPYGVGTAACYIGLDPAEPILVKAVACAAVGVKKTTRLLEEITTTSTRGAARPTSTGTAAPSWSSRRCSPTPPTGGSLSHPGWSVAHIANDIGPMITAIFGGRTPLADAEPPAITG